MINSVNNDELKYTKYILPNGIKCILYKRNQIHSVNIQVSVEVGSLDESENENGISHMIEHLAFDGTEELPTYKDIDRFMNNISGSGNAFTSATDTVYHGSFPMQYIKEAMYYYSQLVLAPIHKNDFINKEKGIIQDEMKMYQDKVQTKLYENVIENRFINKETSFSRIVIGKEKNIKSFDKKLVKNFYNKYYVPNNIEILVVGNFDVRELKKILNLYFHDNIKNKKFNKKPNREFFTKYPEYSNFRINALTKLDLDKYYLTFTFPTKEFLFTKQRERFLIDLVNDNIASAQFQQSVLWKVLREELGMVYGVSSYRSGMVSRAYNTIQTSFSEKDLERVITEVYKGIKLMVSGKLSDEVFNMIKKQVLDTQLMELDSASRASSWIELQEQEERYHNDFMSPNDYLNFIQSLKFEQIIKTAQEMFDFSKLNIGVVSKDNSQVVEKKISKIWQKLIK